jgi:hypothetical protein
MTLDHFVKYMRDALNRFQAANEKKDHTNDRFSVWWRMLRDFVREEHPKTTEIPVKTATNDPEEFKANLPTRPRGRRPE